MSKIICLEKLNSMLVNKKAEKTFAEFDKKNPECVDLSTCTKIVLVKLVLRVPAFKKHASVPFYAFIKHSSTLAVIVDIETGSAQVFDPSVIAAEMEVKDNFRINGVTYGIKDTISGFKRYRPLSYAPKKPRRKLTPLSQEVVEAQKELAMEQDYQPWNRFSHPLYGF